VNIVTPMQRSIIFQNYPIARSPDNCPKVGADMPESGRARVIGHAQDVPRDHVGHLTCRDGGRRQAAVAYAPLPHGLPLFLQGMEKGTPWICFVSS
jgi:hypothetical protein